MKRIISLLFVLVGYTTFGQSVDFQEVENKEELMWKLNTLSTSVSSLKSKFIQHKHISVLEEEIVSEGDLIFERPSNIKWTYLKPISYQISILNGNFTINNDGKVSEYNIDSNKVFKEINNLIVSLVNGSILSSELLDVSLFENNLNIKAVLVPTESNFKRFLKEIHIYFEKRDFMVEKIKMIETSGDYTLIEFYQRELNNKIDRSEFNVGKN